MAKTQAEKDRRLAFSTAVITGLLARIKVSPASTTAAQILVAHEEVATTVDALTAVLEAHYQAWEGGGNQAEP